MREKYLEEISKLTTIEKDTLESLIEIPCFEEMGDLAIPCFSLAKKYRKGPIQIADELSNAFEQSNLFDRVNSLKGYLNFFYNRTAFTKDVLETILNEETNLGIAPIMKGKKVVIEFSSPNIAKPFGIGHLRSTIIGNSISNLYRKVGADVTTINYLGDWGTQFGKLLYGFLRFGDSKELQKDAISHLNDIYVKVNLNISDETLFESRRYFEKLENGDNEALSLWRTFSDLSIKKFEEVYELLGISFDSISGESKYSNKAKELVIKLQNRGLASISQNAIVVDLKDYDLGVVLLEKTDGTSIYSSRDIAAAIDRIEKYNFDEMIYEVGQEQTLHFEQVFKILELLGYETKGKLNHVSHGLYLGTDGKKLSTRKGTSLAMEDLWYQVKESLKSYYSDIGNIPSDIDLNLMTRAAIFYADLKNQKQNDIIFNLQKMVEQNGNTGIYLLYSYARATSILDKSNFKYSNLQIPDDINNIEFALLKKMNDYPKIVEKAIGSRDPSKVANFVYEISQAFNQFYNQCHVIGDFKENFRIHLIKAYTAVLSDGLNLLGIQTLDKI